MITIIVASPREINPLWMTKLISHEVEISFTTKRGGHEPNHLVESHASTHLQRWLLSPVHTEVDLLLEQMHRLGLISNDGLVMGLSVRHHLLLPSTVGHRVH
jgi:hypothetical protein